MIRALPILSGLTLCVALFACAASVSAQESDAIIMDNVVKLEETISPQGFVHPGISCNAETLSVMREKVIAGVSPWVDYFEGLRRTRYANPNQSPRHVGQIVNNGGISGFTHDAQLAWTQTILYVATGDEEYRKLPVDIIKWYGSRTGESFFPGNFADAHIKIGKPVYTMCAVADIMRYTTPQDESLAVTAEMINALQTYCMMPIRKNCIERNYYFMNQHSYAIMGYLASTIMADDLEGYKQAVEWTTVNATTENQGKNGSIKQQFRIVTRNDKTGETVEPNLQVVEMGRDQPHAGGNVDNLLMMAKTIDFQKTKVDPVDGTVTSKANGVSPIHFLDDRIIKGAALFAKYNLGYGLPWIPTYSESSPDNMVTYDQISHHQRGRLGGTNGIPAGYYYFKGVGFDMDAGPYHYIKTAMQTFSIAQEYRARSGVYIDTLHNNIFDFWAGLPEKSSEAEPDTEKAKRALAKELPPLEISREGALVEGIQFEYSFVDLSGNAMPGDIYPGSPEDIPLSVKKDADGTGYVRMELNKNPRTMVVFAGFPSGSGLRVRADHFVKLNFFTGEDYAKKGSLQTIYIPDTNNEWEYVTTDFGAGDILYLEATSLEGPAKIDFDRIDTKPDEVLPLTFDTPKENNSIPTYAGAAIEKSFTATCPDKHLLGGANWKPEKNGAALSLNGKEQYAKLPEGIVSDLDDFTISAWVKLDQIDTWARIFDFGHNTSQYMFLAPSDGKAVKFSITASGSRNEQAIIAKEPLATGSWQHVAVTLSGNTGILYVNGEEAGRNSKLTLKPSSLGKTPNNYIGKSQWPDPYLAGMVDEFTIFNKALTPHEIKALNTVFANGERIDPKSPAVAYKFDQASLEGDQEKVEYAAHNLPAGAALDSASGRLTWTPPTGQTGDHTIYITARNSVAVNTIPVNIHVAKDLQGALDFVATAYDPHEKYESATEEAFNAALKARSLAALQKAANQLTLLTPKLTDGSLDYCKTWSCDIRGSRQMADGDPLTWGGVWGDDKNVTMDFGNRFKVKADSFGIQARDGFPIRVAEAVVYGSNDNANWTLLTGNAAKKSPDMQILKVKAEEKNNAYRYLRFFMPRKPYHIFEISELRIFGERIEAYSPDYHVAYIEGYADGTFKPGKNMTRAEAASLLSRLVNDYTDKGAYQCGYSDVAPGASYYDDVAYMAMKKFITADGNKFRPDDDITRGEFADFMARMNRLDVKSGDNFSDVTANMPHAEAIRSVAAQGWMKAGFDGSFQPDALMTRAEIVTAVNKMLQRKCGAKIKGAQEFKDVDQSHPAYFEIMEAVNTHPVE